MSVGSADILIDFLDQFLHAPKCSAANGLLGDPVEPDLHLVQPRGIGRSEVYVESWMCRQPAFHSRMLVCPIVVHDHMDFQLGRNIRLNLP